MAIFKNIELFISDLDSRKKSIKDAIKTSVLDTHTKMTQRIFDRGQNSDGFQFKYKSATHRKKRRNAGKQVSFVDFKFTNDLQSDFRGSSNLSSVKPTRINDETFRIELNRINNQEKRQGLDEEFNDVFSISDEEVKGFLDVLKKEVLFRLNG